MQREVTFLRIIFAFFLVHNLVACSLFSSKDNKETAELYMRMGIGNYQQENYPAALKNLLKAEELDPQNPVIHNNLGLVYFMRERYDLAEKSIRKALTLNSKYSDARNNLSRVLIEQGRNKEAEVESRLVIEDLTYGDIEKAYLNLGLAQFNQSHFQESKETFLKAINAKNDSCLAHSYYGRSLFELKDLKPAAEALDRAIGFCQRQLYVEPHYFSAICYYRLEQPEKSAARFQEILKLYPAGSSKYRDKAASMLEIIRKGQ